MSDDITPPKPSARKERVSVFTHIRLFRQDIFASQPAKLYRAWMAEFRMLLFKSYFINDPNLVGTVLKKRSDDFPKSEIVTAGLFSLLGKSVFVTNGDLWKKQRRIIDPAFEGGRLRDVFPSMLAAANESVGRLGPLADGTPVEIEEQTSQLAADVIFRTLFSIPISDEIASETFEKFRAYQRTQPLLNIAAFLKRPSWVPKMQRRATKRAAHDVRTMLTRLTMDRAAMIANGAAPDDLATKIMTTRDPETGDLFTSNEMVDQVAIFFLAGHETSASALAWALYLLALDQDAQARVFDEISTLDEFTFGNLSKLPFTRDVFRETLRLYPPVPMMVRETTRPEIFRERKIKVGSQIILSPWHIQRHERLWDRPDVFDPDRWKTDETRKCAREAYMPFSAGTRVCTGAGFAMVEGVVLLTTLIRAYKFEVVAGQIPTPVAHLTVRAKDGIYVRLTKR
ncbi:cytochrome P450 [Amylibacter ulvae]|uniref:Cytochrome P450 n=1 Tax=Paramylibacter ulvae TaxID=1651968 RepID=A0ABQ3CT07_9RHOB|nr:cytochrome P450 [Amylibacter ulvae]GHA40123.1 cytochrome P450 [Amylibacter ulvae]